MYSMSIILLKEFGGYWIKRFFLLWPALYLLLSFYLLVEARVYSFGFNFLDQALSIIIINHFH